MPQLKLTNTAIKKLKCPTDKKQIDFWDKQLSGLGLRVGISGTKTFNCQARVLREGRWRDVRVKLGTYPAMSLAEAREKATATIRAAKNRKDPKEIEREDEREAVERSRNTFSACRDLFLERYCVKRLRPSTFKECRRTLFSSDFNPWEARSVSSLRKRDALELLDNIVDRGAEYMANRTLSYGRMMFNFLIDREILDSSPFDRVKPPTKEVPRERVLANSELRSIWAVLETCAGVFEIPAKIMLLTGQRAGEVVGMRRSELKTWREVLGDDVTNKTYSDFDFDELVWSMPNERTKNGRAHIVPLAPTVRALLGEVMENGTDFLFVSSSSLTRAIKRERPAFSLSGISNAKKRVDKASGVDNWVWHDMRRTLVTGMNDQLGIHPHIVEAVINHLSGASKAGVAGVYNRASYLSERRQALFAWADLLESIVTDRDRVKVEGQKAAREKRE